MHVLGVKAGLCHNSLEWILTDADKQKMNQSLLPGKRDLQYSRAV